jgi:uncharacterized protein YcbK (DUF882 family)
MACLINREKNVVTLSNGETSLLHEQLAELPLVLGNEGVINAYKKAYEKKDNKNIVLNPQNEPILFFLSSDGQLHTNYDSALGSTEVGKIQIGTISAKDVQFVQDEEFDKTNNDVVFSESRIKVKNQSSFSSIMEVDADSDTQTSQGFVNDMVRRGFIAGKIRKGRDFFFQGKGNTIDAIKINIYEAFKQSPIGTSKLVGGLLEVKEATKLTEQSQTFLDTIYQNVFPEKSLRIKLENALQQLGVEVIPLDEYKKRYELKYGEQPSVEALASASKGIIALTKAEQLEEEAAHLLIEGYKDQQLIEELLPLVTSHPLYEKYAERYMKIYKNENTVRKEILGKILASKFTDTSSPSLLQKIKEFLERVLSKILNSTVNKLEQALQDIANQMLNNTRESIDLDFLGASDQEFYSLSSSTEAIDAIKKLAGKIETIVREGRFEEAKRLDIKFTEASLEHDVKTLLSFISAQAIVIDAVASKPITSLVERQNVYARVELLRKELKPGLESLREELESRPEYKHLVKSAQIVEDSVAKALTKSTQLSKQDKLDREKTKQIMSTNSQSSKVIDYLWDVVERGASDMTSLYRRFGLPMFASDIRIKAFFTGMAKYDVLAAQTNIDSIGNLLKKAKELNLSMSDMKSFISNGSHYFKSWFNYSKYDEDYKAMFEGNIKTQLEKELSEIDPSSDRYSYIQKLIEGNIFAVEDLTQQQQRRVKYDMMKFTAENEYRRNLPEYYLKNIESIEATISQIKVDSEFEGMTSDEIRDFVYETNDALLVNLNKQANATTEIEKKLFKIERKITLSEVDDLGELKQGYQKQQAKIARTLQSNFFNVFQTSKTTQTMIDELSSLQTVEEIEEFVNNNARIDKESLTIIENLQRLLDDAFLDNDVEIDITRLIELYTIRKGILSQYRDPSNPSNIMVSVMNVNTKLGLLRIDEEIGSTRKGLPSEIIGELSSDFNLTIEPSEDLLQQMQGMSLSESVDFVRDLLGTPVAYSMVKKSTVSQKLLEDLISKLPSYYKKFSSEDNFNFSDYSREELIAELSSMLDGSNTTWNITPSYDWRMEDTRKQYLREDYEATMEGIGSTKILIKDEYKTNDMFDQFGIQYDAELGYDITKYEPTKNKRNFDAYKMFIEINKAEVHEKLNEKNVNIFQRPQVRSTGLDRTFRSLKDPVGEWKRFLEDMTQNQIDDQEYGAKDSAGRDMNTSSNNKTSTSLFKKIPKYYIRQVADSKDLTDDLVYAYAQLISQSNKHIARKNKEAIYYQTLLAVDATDFSEERYIKAVSGEDSQTKKFVKDYADSEIYGIRESLKINYKVFGKDVDFTKIISNISSGMSKRNIAYNLYVAGSGFIQGNAAKVINAVSGKEFNNWDLIFAEKEWSRQVGEYISELGSTVRKNKIHLIEDYFNIKNVESKAEFASYNKAFRLTKDRGYVFSQLIGEPINITQTISILNNYRVVGQEVFTYKSFIASQSHITKKEAMAVWENSPTIYSLLEVKDGKLDDSAIKNLGVNNYENIVNSIRLTIINANSKTDGQIPSNMKSAMSKHVLGRLPLIHSTWLNLIAHRTFQPTSIGTDLTLSQGWTNTIADFVKHVSSSAKLKNDKTVIQNILRSYSTFVKEAEDIGVGQMRRRNINEILATQGAVTLLYLLAMALKSWADDEEQEDSYLAQFIATIAVRGLAETRSNSIRGTFYGSYEKLQSPVVLTTTIKEILSASTYYELGEEVKSGKYEGLTKAEKMFLKLTYWKHLYNYSSAGMIEDYRNSYIALNPDHLTLLTVDKDEK